MTQALKCNGGKAKPTQVRSLPQTRADLCSRRQERRGVAGRTAPPARASHHQQMRVLLLDGLFPLGVRVVVQRPQHRPRDAQRLEQPPRDRLRHASLRAEQDEHSGAFGVRMEGLGGLHDTDLLPLALAQGCGEPVLAAVPEPRLQHEVAHLLMPQRVRGPDLRTRWCSIEAGWVVQPVSNTVSFA